MLVVPTPAVSGVLPQAPAHTLGAQSQAGCHTGHLVTSIVIILYTVTSTSIVTMYCDYVL